MTASNESNIGPCPFGPLVGAYHDGELPADQSAEVAGHVRACPACAAELADLRRFTGAFRAAPRPASVPPADDVLARLEQELSLSPASSPPPPMRLVPEPEPGDRHASPPAAAAARGVKRPTPRPAAPSTGHLRLARWLTAAAAAVGLLATGRVVYDRLQPPGPGGPSPTGVQTTHPERWPTHTQPAPPARRTTYEDLAPGR